MYALLTKAPAEGRVTEDSDALKHFHLRKEGGYVNPRAVRR